MRKLMLVLMLFSFTLFSACDHIEQVYQDEQVEQQEVTDEATTSEKKLSKKTDESTDNEKDLSKSESLTVSYLDVGQGDATLFQFSDGKENYTILYDTGDWLGNQVPKYLNDKKIDYIDLVIISHPHADHIGQLQKVMESFDVGEVWMTGNATNTKVFQSAMEAVLQSDADYEEPTAGDLYDIGPLELYVLHPAKLSGGLNEDSLSINMTFGQISFLFTGDAYKEQELSMLNYPDHIQADFLHVGHHGSNTSSDSSFIEAVSPTYAIYSAGTDNSYGHPHQEVVQLFKDTGITLYGTDVNGTITVQTDGKDYEVLTDKEGIVKKGHEDTTKIEPNKNDTVEMEENTAGCIDINTASKNELMEITQIGEARADELITLRPFQSIDELTKIDGIGEARLKDIKQQGKACLGGN
ncbi:MBL fold metallo-hydrolase [Pseudogracilibacillus sp. SE30717A]|uniref:MBL fold metallo-hydrolase n=1 Tax=Pseudogracilibacillus sp. SE30717A TaxID=3098293 RepID=UPI00300E3938